MASTHHDNAGTTPARKVRVVAKLRGILRQEPDSEPKLNSWISVNKPQGENFESVTLSFGEQSSSRYWMHYCYEEHEENELIYSREVKPLVSAVFEGHNSTVIACGARGSGKTHLIQGSAEKPGLAMLAIAEFTSLAEKNGKSISISFYEVDHQDHAVDLLNPGHPPILVYEDRGRIQFKGLSQIPVKSVAEFQNFYFAACSAQKTITRKGFEHARRSHMGLIVNVFSQNASVENGLVSKMSFVDLAGYEDARKKSSDTICLAETNKINKSIYALMNVSHALSTNESRVPYRESKLTRMLQDSLRGTGRILIVACLNPSFCQDTIYMVSLASRSCQSIQRTFLDSTKKISSSASQIKTYQKRQITKSVLKSAKKIPASVSCHSEKKVVAAPKSAIKARKLFDEASNSAARAKKEISMVQNSSETLLVNQDNSLDITENHVESNTRVVKDNSLPDASKNVKGNLMVENGDSSLNTSSEVEIYPIEEKGISLNGEDHQDASNFYEAVELVHEDLNMNKENNSLMIIEQGQQALAMVQEGQNINKENNSSMAYEDGSTPISSQLRDLSNRFKWLYSSTPWQISEKECISLDSTSVDIMEPKTPVVEQTTSLNDRRDIMNPKSPWETFSVHGSGMKNSLVEEYLRFLNSANKEELKKLKGIGEKRATYILELREESPEPFKSLDDLRDIGLSAKQIKGIMKKEVGELFN
ncbi:hypothetical protein HN51_009494 [Arachis hypogaea]|uniref:Kinesin motor domain-containing protein n=1 Tax=Arachis hypogaea TaxID=3818 RepID=A0A445CZ45_ARAHY|nr:kinesin-like protein KIN-10C isoform X2 [Arachis hypogaea]QHO44011.1 uncharacterized protein DS421_5g167540 [Arachis hypogaea]RYR56188.1 hypothetical protein Ahy_A05g021951 [Arachis hypogaea]